MFVKMQGDDYTTPVGYAMDIVHKNMNKSEIDSTL